MNKNIIIIVLYIVYRLRGHIARRNRYAWKKHKEEHLNLFQIWKIFDMKNDEMNVV